MRGIRTLLLLTLAGALAGCAPGPGHGYTPPPSAGPRYGSGYQYGPRYLNAPNFNYSYGAGLQRSN
jgi:hypothetical protein